MWARAAALLALLAAGCGGGPSDADRVRATVSDYARAVARHDARALCSRVLAPGLVAAVERASGQRCPAAVRGVLAGGAPRGRPGSVLVDGGLARAGPGGEAPP